MNAVLAGTIEKLQSNNYNELTVVLGNESCDLDSAVSALCYSTFLHWQYMQIKCKVCTRIHRDEKLYKDDIFIPVLNIDREDFPLKTEVQFCLKEHGFEEGQLIFRNDYDLNQCLSTHKVNIVLVDHHILSAHDAYLLPYVTEIIDHRPADRDNWKYKDDMRSTLETVGSCATLVAQRIKDLSVLVAKKDIFFQTYGVCTDLLHSAILLDTVNFSKEVGKATRHDEDIVDYLESILKPNSFYEEARKCKLDRLVSARKDVSALTSAQLIKKDLKVVENVLIPSFPIMVEEFLQRPDAIEAVTESLDRRGCNMALLLGMNLENGLRRDLALMATKPGGTEEFATFLQEWQPPLKLKSVKLPGIDSCQYFTQGDLTASRKQYIVAMNQFSMKNKDVKEQTATEVKKD